MQIESLKVYCDLVEVGSFSEAARRNGITQSAVSQQIGGLEKRYGVKFFERGRKSFSVTAEGEVFYSSAQKILGIYNGIKDSLDGLQDRVGGSLRIAAISSIGFHELPLKLEEFRRLHPEVEIKVDYKRSSTVYDEVLNGVVDLGLVACPKKMSGIIVDEFSRDRLVLACAAGHHLASRKSIKTEELDGEEMIAFEPDQPTRRALDRIFRGAGIKAKMILEVDNLETLKRAVEVSSSMSIVPEKAVEAEVEAGKMKVVELEGDDYWRPLAVLRQQSGTTTRAMRAFLDCLLGKKG